MTTLRATKEVYQNDKILALAIARQQWRVPELDIDVGITTDVDVDVDVVDVELRLAAPEVAALAARARASACERGGGPEPRAGVDEWTEWALHELDQLHVIGRRAHHQGSRHVTSTISVTPRGPIEGVVFGRGLDLHS